MKIRLVLPTLFLAALLTGCGSGSSPPTASPPPASPPPASSPPASSPPAEDPPDASLKTVSAFVRSGQVFLTWPENNAAEGYNIYRVEASTVRAQDLVPQNLVVRVPRNSGENRVLRDLSEDTSAYGRSGWPRLDPPSQFTRNVIAPLDTSASGSASAVPPGTEMVVLTTKRPGRFSYAVASIVNGVERITLDSPQGIDVAGPLTEVVAQPEPVLIWQANTKAARIYLQYVDVEEFNSPHFAWPYWVGVRPQAVTDGHGLLEVYLSGGDQHMTDTANSVSEYEQLAYDVSVKVRPTEHWELWYGHSSSARPGDVPEAGVIVNYTQARVMNFLRWMLERSPYYSAQADPNRVVMRGASNGGFGCLQFAFNYPDVFAFADCMVPPTKTLAMNYGGGAYDQYHGRSGDTRITASFLGWMSEPLNAQFSGTTMTDWLNLDEMVLRHPGRTLPWIHVRHGANDTVLGWPRFGQSFYTNLNSARHAFSGGLDGDGDHGYVGVARPEQLSSLRKNESFPAVSNSTVNASLPLPDDPPDSGLYLLNTHLLWSTPRNRVGGYQGMVDEAGRYELVLGSSRGDDIADVTPRRMQNFRVTPGARYVATNVAVNDPLTVYQSVVIVADADARLTFPGFQIKAASADSGGSRLVITPQP